jgi:hypothetical protein
MSPALRRHSSQTQAAFPTPTPSKHPGKGSLANQAVHCGICRSKLEGEGLHRHEGREQLGSYCSPACLSAVEALAALQLWSVRLDACGRRDEAEVRATLADDLLVAWRRHAGPDPRGVIAAVELAQRRDGPHPFATLVPGL